LLYRVTNKETKKEIAMAKTGLVFFDYSSRRILSVPDKFKTLFRDHP
jgi:acyl-CoA thioester hydrolase